MHIEHYGTAAKRARRRLAHLDPIAESDDDEKEAHPADDGLRANDADLWVDGDAPSGEKVM